jgi:hypothetical protein
MRPNPWAPLLSRGRATWTCSRCKHAKPTLLDNPCRTFRSRAGRPVRILRPRKAVYWAAAGGSLGGSLLFFGDDIKHGWHAAERTGRVVSTLAVNINEYAETDLRLRKHELTTAILKLPRDVETGTGRS